MEWVRRSYPTPHGPIRVEVKRTADGTPQTTVDVPKGVERVREWRVDASAATCARDARTDM